MSRPATDPPTWATAASAEITEPPSQRKTAGWTSGLIPPAGYWNWWMELVGEWLTFLSTAPPVYADLGEAVLDTVAGDICCVSESIATDTSLSNATYDTPGKAAGNDLADVATYGSHLVIFEVGAAAAYRVARAAPATTVTTYTKTQAGTNRRVICDGVYTVILYGNYVECFGCESGASLWSYDHGGTLHDLCFKKNYVVFTGAAGTGTKTTRMCKLLDGSSVTSYNHGAVTYACTANGSQVFICGATSGFASGSTIRALTNSGGGFYDAANEGGAGAADSGLVWDAVQLRIVSNAGAMVADGRALYVGYDEVAAAQLEIRSPVDGAVLVSRVLANLQAVMLAVDADFLLVATKDTASGNRGHVAAHDKSTLATCWVYRMAAATQVLTVATDGAAVWAGIAIGAGTKSFYRLYRDNRPTLFRRMDYAEAANGDNNIPHGLRRQLVADRR